MKLIFTLINIFLLGTLAFVGIANDMFDEFSSFIIFCLLLTPLVIALAYTNGSFRNHFIKWLLFAVYQITALSLFYLILVENSNIKELILGLCTVGALVFNSLYIFQFKIRNIDQIYIRIAKEKEEGYKDEGLWIKAVSMSGGNDKKIESLYIKLRVKKLLEQGDK